MYDACIDMVGLQVTLEEDKEAEHLATEVIVKDTEDNSSEIGETREVKKVNEMESQEIGEEFKTEIQQAKAEEKISMEAEGNKFLVGEVVKEDSIEIRDTGEVGKESEIENHKKDEEINTVEQQIKAGEKVNIEAEGKVLLTTEDAKENGLEIGDSREVGSISEIQNKVERINTETQQITAGEKVPVTADTDNQEDEDSETEDMTDYYNQPEILTDEERDKSEERERVSLDNEMDEIFEEIEKKEDDESRKKNEERDMGTAV